MNDAQLSLHGFREAVKFFVDLGKSNKTGMNALNYYNVICVIITFFYFLEKLAAGGIGYVDFRTATVSNLSSSSPMLVKSHLIMWQS